MYAKDLAGLDEHGPCDRTSHRTAQKAAKAARRTNENSYRRGSGARAVAEKCNACDGWHVVWRDVGSGGSYNEDGMRVASKPMGRVFRKSEKGRGKGSKRTRKGRGLGKHWVAK